jgi:chromosome segregation ATPase
MDINIKMNNSISAYIEDIQVKLSDLNTIIDKDFDSKLNNLNNTIAELTNKINILTTENNGLKTMNEYLNSDKVRLQAQINNLEEDHRNFTKVSKIIALENENDKLRKELDEIKFKGTSPVKKKAPFPFYDTATVSPLVAKIETLPEKQYEPLKENIVEQQEPLKEELEEEEDIQVTEKKIGNIIYYIDDAKKVFIKEDDGTIGNEIGFLSKINGKTKLIKSKV